MEKIIVIIGPTASGKTKLSLEIAKEFNGEIINADSTQMYRGLDVATAKIKDLEGVVHHLIDIKDISEDYTVYDFKKDASFLIEDIIKRGKTPIIVGGTGLYINALLYDYNFDDIDKKYSFDHLSLEELYEEVLLKDPFNKIHKNNRRRLERSLIYYLENNEPFSSKKEDIDLKYDATIICLIPNREELYNYINKRVDSMVSLGLIKEAKKIYDTKIRTKAVMTPIGYKELFEYFDNNISLEEALDNIRRNTRHYAKRQLTWFKNKLKPIMIDVDYNDFNKTIEEAKRTIKKAFS